MQTQIIQNNLEAMFANRQLKITGTGKAKTSEKLSSGYRINRSADDAAGLAISEKMRWQIRGLNRASKNIQDGISFDQTADGYLNEVDSILQRIRELAVESSNDTNTPEDRMHLDEEVQALKKETKRIFKTAEFNTIKIWNEPYMPDPAVMEEEDSWKLETPATGGLPSGVSMTPTGRSSYDAGRGHYSTAAFFDFSGINSSNISSLDGTGFHVNAADGTIYSVTFDSSTNENSIVGHGADSKWEGAGRNGAWTITVGTAGCTSAQDVVKRIAEAADGKSQEDGLHFTVSCGDTTDRTLVVYDKVSASTINQTGMTVGNGYYNIDHTKKYEADFQVFNEGVDAYGNVIYGGVEINDVRHRWNEMNPPVPCENGVFTEDWEVDFYDYDNDGGGSSERYDTSGDTNNGGEHIHLKGKKGDPAYMVTRTYDWDAKTDGIYVNNVLAADWDTVLATEDEGSYSFTYNNMTISFDVNPGDGIDDMIVGIHGDQLRTAYTWDVSGVDGIPEQNRTKALDIINGNAVFVTNANQNVIDADYRIKADDNGITIQDSLGQSHATKTWGTPSTTVRTSDDDLAISDWGDIYNVDGASPAYQSDNTTFDDMEYYNYTDDVNSLVPISFDFVLEDEASRDSAIAALNGVRFKNMVDAPWKMNVIPEDRGISIYFKKDNMDFEGQRTYHRDFDDSDARITGSITRKLEGSLRQVGSPTTNTDGIRNSSSPSDYAYNNTGTVYTYYLDTGNGMYKKYNIKEQAATLTNARNLVTTEQGTVHYSYSGDFAGETMDGVRGNDFTMTQTTTEYQTATQNWKRYVFEDAGEPAVEASDMQGRWAGRKLQDAFDAGKKSGTTVIGNGTAQGGFSAYSTQSTTIKRTGNSRDEVKIVTASGSPATVEFSSYDGHTAVGNTQKSKVEFKAEGFASRTFAPDEKSMADHNVNVESLYLEAKVSPVAERELNIQAGAQAWQNILERWTVLTNSVIGISGTNVKTFSSAQRAIRQVDKALEIVNGQRADWGAWTNRLEHAKASDDNTSENTQASESRIRDADMADEMVRHSKHSILEQVGQTVLSQANQKKDMVLQLLQ